MANPRRHPDRHSAGFTLIEMLVGLTIFGAIAVIVTVVMLTSDRTHRRTVSRAELQAACRQTLTLMTTEIRQAGSDPSIPPVGIVGIVAADTNSVRVRADLDGNGAIQTTEPSEDVTFTYDPATQTLSRNPGTGAATLMTGVTDARFSYFDSADQPLASMPLSATDRSLVHSIGLTVTCSARDAEPLTLTTRVTLRNQ